MFGALAVTKEARADQNVSDIVKGHRVSCITRVFRESFETGGMTLIPEVRAEKPED